MNKATRLQYLKAMGIDVWMPIALHRIEAEIEYKTGVAALSVNAVKPLESGKIATDIIAPELKEKWQVVEQQVASCQLCSLSQTRTRTVFGAGNKNSDWLLVGEAPGQDEDREGLPFVGRAGQLLTEMIRALGLARDDVYIANILKCRPPNNRNPKIEEAKACNNYLKQQIAMIQPKIILAIGRVAAQNLLKTDETISQLRGKVHYLDTTPVIVIYHPAYLLRSLLEKRKAWQDLQSALKFFRTGKN